MIVYLVTGSRDYINKNFVRMHFQPEKLDIVIEGGAEGVDTFCREIALENGAAPLTINAKWKEFGDLAGGIRNNWMRDICLIAKNGGQQVLVKAFPVDNILHGGTKDMVEKARKAKLAGHIYYPDGRIEPIE